MQFIDLKESDLIGVKEIYDYYILNSTATFHTERISIEELKEMFHLNHSKYRSYLVKADNELCGYCYFTQYKKRKAYDRTAEISIYLKPQFKGMGIGGKIIQYLENRASKNGIKIFIGIICEENKASTRLFEKCGYEKCAHFKQVGEKFDKILDVVAYQKVIC